LRKLKIFFITLICLLASNVAFTLGVGNIEVKSALSEPLDAEIKLFSVRPGEGDNIRVTLATLKEFTAAGIDRTLNLSALKFKVVEKGDGNAYIKVYSDRPIREPFLDFLVDIDWPSGRLLREYTLLLDPPIFAQRKAAPVQTPVVAAPTRVIRESTPAPAPSFNSSPVPSAPVVRSAEDDLFPRIELDAAPAQTLDSSTRAPAASSFTGDSYQVKKSETLWSIADSVRPNDDIGVSQMMLALQKANPDAFTKNNINGLKSGVVLRIPDLADIQAFDRDNAVQVAKQQNQLWRSAQDNLTTSATPTGTTTTTPSSTSQPAGSSVTQESTVKLVTPDSKASGTQGAGSDDGVSAEQLALANEQLASKSTENEKLQERVKSLEDQIGSMERLLELKDDSLSDLQTKLSDAKSEPVAPPIEDVVPEPVEPEVAETKPEPVIEEKKAEPVKPLVDDSKINPYALDEIPEVKTPAAPAPAPAKQKPAEPSLFDDPVILAAIIAVVIAVLALIWLVMQRRRNNMQFPESILSGKPAAAASTTTTSAAANAETSLLSDFAPSAMDGAMESDSSEVDPSAEADVYIAYGKHQQAEELLLSAIEQEPDRLDLRLKLMEVYHATGNADSFLTHATQLNDSMDDQNTALWDKAVVMGRELCPGNELFGADETSSEDDFSDLDGIGDLDDDLDLTLDMNDVADASDAEELSVDNEDELSLDMELESFESSKDEDDDLTLEIDELSLDMDDVSETTTETTETSSESEPAVDFGDLELELDEAQVEPEAELEISDVETPAEPESSLDLDVDSGLSDDAATADVDDAMLGMDEVATKLDLAKAYIDMGDPDGARAILDEVLTEGNDDQQSEAKGLIDQL